MDIRFGTPSIVAHRGASAERPENSVSAFDRALAEGADAIELDLQLSKDGVPVVLHDRGLGRMGRPGRHVHELPLAELQRLDIGGERMPTFEEVLDRYGPKITYLVEVKARPPERALGLHLPLATKVIELLRARRLIERAMLLSFELEVLEHAHCLAPELWLVLNLRRAPAFTAADRAAFAPLFALSIDVADITEAMVRSAHELGKRVMVHGCDSEADVERGIAAGADAFMTKSPEWLAGLLRERAE